MGAYDKRKQTCQQLMIAGEAGRHIVHIRARRANVDFPCLLLEEHTPGG